MPDRSAETLIRTETMLKTAMGETVASALADPAVIEIMKQNTQFRHESLQDSKSVERLLGALIDGISEGKVVLEDDDGTLEFPVKGLANLRISASQDEDRNRLDIRLTWRIKQKKPGKKQIRIHSGSDSSP